MGFMHTARYYRSKEYNKTPRQTRPPVRIHRLSRYSRNPRRDYLFKLIFYNSEEENAVLTSHPILNFTSFEYSQDGKLKISLRMMGEIVWAFEILEENKVTEIIKALSEKKISKWVVELLHDFNFHFSHEYCLTNISVTYGDQTSSLFCVLRNPESDVEIIELDDDADQSQAPPPNPAPVGTGSQAQNPAPVGTGSQAQNPAPVGTGSQAQNAAPVETHPAPVQAQNSPNSAVPNNATEAPAVEDISEINLPSQVVEDGGLESKCKSFLTRCELIDEAFILHHDKKGQPVTTIYFVFTEKGISSVYEIKEVRNYMEDLVFLKTAEISQMSSMKIEEFVDGQKKGKDFRIDLIEYIYLLFQSILLDSTYLNLLYTSFSSENTHISKVMELNIIYKDGVEYKFENDLQYELPIYKKYFVDKVEIVRIGDVSLHWHDLLSLCPPKWLNDVVIDAYLNLIAERSKAHSYNLPSVYVFNTYFLKRLVSRRVNYRRLPASDILHADIILIPENIGREHWALYCVDNRTKTILHYDSLRHPPRCLDWIYQFLNDLSVRKFGVPVQYTLGMGMAVRQLNNYDCGVFLISHAECLSRNQPFNFTQKDMPQIRGRIMEELLDQKLSTWDFSFSETSVPNVLSRDTFLKMKSVKSICECGFLDEVAVDAYLKLIVVRSKQLPEIYPSVVALKSSYLPTLQCGAVQLLKYEAAKILGCDMLFIPFDSYGVCWTLFCVNNRKNTILCYNPSNSCTYENEMNLIEVFLNTAAKVLNVVLPSYRKGTAAAAVQEARAGDCGLILLMHAEYLSRGEKFHFVQNQMSDIRSLVIYELVVQKLSSPLPDICPAGFVPLPHDVQVGCTGDQFGTLFFNIPVEDFVVESYMDLLKQQRGVWVYPAAPDPSKQILLFPFRNKRGWALIAVDKGRIYYYNIPSAGDNLQLVKLFYPSLELSALQPTHLPFSEHFIDSGVYVLATAHCLAQGMDVAFGGKHVAFLRKRIYWDLCAGFLHPGNNQGSTNIRV